MATKRSRNPRGEGSRLRDEILNGARILSEEDGEQAITLRAVARRVGISAPAIYAHFPDRDAIVNALIDEAFDELTAAVSSAIDAETDPAQGLQAGCAAYLEFAMSRPNRYELAFAARAANTSPRASATTAFSRLVDAVGACVTAGLSVSTDPTADATTIWVALHGYATLHASRPAFPWPATAATVNRMVRRLAALPDPPPPSVTPAARA